MGISEGNRPLVRHDRRWKNNILRVLRNMVGIAQYGHLTQEMDKWLTAFRTVIDAMVHKNAWNFFTR